MAVEDEANKGVDRDMAAWTERVKDALWMLEGVRRWGDRAEG